MINVAMKNGSTWNPSSQINRASNNDQNTSKSVLKRINSIPLDQVSDTPVHKLKGVNLTYNGPTTVSVHVQKNTTRTLSQINSVQKHESGDIWPCWSVRAWSQHTSPEPYAIEPIQDLPKDQATTSTKLLQKNLKLKTFRNELQHRMKELEDKKRMMVGAVLDKVEEEFLFNYKQSVRRDTTPHKAKLERKDIVNQTLQKCLSDENISLQDLPQERTYIVHPDEPYHFHKQHFVPEKQAKDALDYMPKKSRDLNPLDPTLTDPVRELNKFYKAGWIDEMKKKQTVRLYSNTIKRFANEERQKVIQLREAEPHKPKKPMKTHSPALPKRRKEAYAVRNSTSSCNSKPISLPVAETSSIQVLADWYGNERQQVTAYEPRIYADEEIDELHL